MDWSAQAYLRFEDERTRPARDLLSAVPSNDVAQAVDLGCGPGNSTELVAERFPRAALTGVDTSPDMLDKARARLPEASFELVDIADWEAERPLDLIFANASLQWVPDHEVLLPRLVRMLAPGGSLAVQLPDNLHEPSHLSMRDAAQGQPWSHKLAGAEDERTAIGTPSFFYDLLKPFCRRVDVWRTTYHHPLDGARGVVDWFASTGLRPYLNRLDEDEGRSFIAEYRRLVGERYPLQSDGTLLLPFPRLFIVATR